MCCICKDLKKNLNSLDVNCVPLCDTIESGTPKRAKISCKKFIATVVVGLLHFSISYYLVYMSTTTR